MKKYLEYLLTYFFQILSRVFYYISYFFFSLLSFLIFIVILGINTKEKDSPYITLSKEVGFNLGGLNFLSSFKYIFESLSLLDFTFITVLLNTILKLYDKKSIGRGFLKRNTLFNNNIISLKLQWAFFLLLCLLSYLLGAYNFLILSKFLLFIYDYFFK